MTVAIFVKDFCFRNSEMSAIALSIDFDLVLNNQIAIVKGSTTMLYIKGGSGSTYYGYNNKYLDIARTINEKYGLTVAVSLNKLFSKLDLKDELQSVFKAMNTHYQVLFAGVSSGAVAAIEQAPEIYDLQRFLLINPPFTISLPKIKRSLEAKKDATFNFVFGSNDPTYRFLPLLDNVKSQSPINLKIVEGADHNFKGMQNEFKSLFVKFVEDNSKYQNNTI